MPRLYVNVHRPARLLVPLSTRIHLAATVKVPCILSTSTDQDEKTWPEILGVVLGKYCDLAVPVSANLDALRVAGQPAHYSHQDDPVRARHCFAELPVLSSVPTRWLHSQSGPESTEFKELCGPLCLWVGSLAHQCVIEQGHGQKRMQDSDSL